MRLNGEPCHSSAPDRRLHGLALGFLAAPAVHAKSNLLKLLAQKGEPTVSTDDGFRLSTRDGSMSTPPSFQAGTQQPRHYAAPVRVPAARTGRERRRQKFGGS